VGDHKKQGHHQLRLALVKEQGPQRNHADDQERKQSDAPRAESPA